MVVREHHHHVGEVAVAECDDLVTVRLVVLTWIKKIGRAASQLDPPLVGDTVLRSPRSNKRMPAIRA